MRTSNDYVKIFLYVSLMFVFLFVGLPAKAADKENCLMCHKYRFLGRIDENGRRINYNVSEHIYSKTVHYNVPCRDCHTNIAKLPHDPVTEEVNCANVCHINPVYTRVDEKRIAFEKTLDRLPELPSEKRGYPGLYSCDPSSAAQNIAVTSGNCPVVCQMPCG